MCDRCPPAIDSLEAERQWMLLHATPEARQAMAEAHAASLALPVRERMRRARESNLAELAALDARRAARQTD